MPFVFLKTAAKYALSLNPHFAAISVTESFWFSSIFCAFIMRTYVIYSLSPIPDISLNLRDRWLSLTAKILLKTLSDKSPP